MRDYTELSKSVHCCVDCEESQCEICPRGDTPFSYIECKRKLSDDAADAIEELLAVCRDIAAFVIHYADDDEVSAEVLCRKLHKIGVVEKDGAWWTLADMPKKVE